MPNIGTLTVSLVAQATAFEKTMLQAQRTMESTAKAFERSARRMESLGRNLMLSVSAPLALVGGGAIKMAMDAVESENLFEVAMGGMASAARQWSEDLRKQLGLNAYEVRRNVATLFQMTSSMGLAQQSAYNMSTGLTQLAYDMASFYNLQPEVAFEKLRSGIAGQTEPLKQLGILVDEATVKQTLLNKGLVAQGHQLTQQQKVLGRYLAIMEQTTNAQGDLARTIDSPTNRLRVLRTQIEGAAIDLGMGLIPAFQTVLPHVKNLANMVSNLAQSFAKLPAPIQSTVFWLGLLAIAAGPVALVYSGILRLTGLMMSGAAGLAKMAGRAAFAFASWRGGAASLGEALLYLAKSRFRLFLGGIGVIVTASLLVAAYWRQLAGVAMAVWHAIGAAALYGASLVVRGVGLILAGIGAIIPPVRGAAQAVLGLADSLKASAGQSLASAKSALSMANTAQQAAQNQQSVAQAGQQAAASQDELAKSTEAAAKAAESNIQSFDEVHQIQEKAAEGPAGMEIPEVAVSDMPGIGGIAAGIASGMGDQMASIADKAAAAWDRLKQAMEPVNRAVQWIRDNWPTIGPIVEGIASALTVFLLPALIKTGVEALITGGKVLVSWVMQSAGAIAHGAVIVGQFAVQVAKWAWLGVEALANAGKVVLAWAMQGWQAVASVAAQVGQMIIAGAKWVWLGIQAGIGAAQVVAAWVVQRVQAVASVAVQIAQFVLLGAKWVWMGITATANAAVMAAAWFIALGPVAWVTATVIALAIFIIAKWDWIKTKTSEIWSAVSDWLSRKWDWIKGIAETVWNWIKDHIIAPIQAAWDWLVATWNSIGVWLSEKWGWIKTTAGSLWDSIKTSIMSPIQSVWDWLKTTWGSIASFLSDTWKGIKDKAADLWKGLVNSIIGFINRIIDALNAMIKGMNKLSWSVPDWVPIIGGKSFGFNLPTIGKIPMLAQGGLVTAPTLAVVGEAGPEAVVPLSRDNVLADSIAQAVYRAVVDGFRISQATQSQGDHEIVLRIDSATFARLILPAIIKEGQRQGLQFVARPQGV